MKTEVFEIAQAVLLSIGGGSLIIAVFSTWLGKVWANRILETDRNKYAQEMESIRQSNKSITDALSTASSGHSESVKIFSELRCNAVSHLWDEFLKIKKLAPLSVSFADLCPDGKNHTEHAREQMKADFPLEKQKDLMQLTSENLSPYLDDRHLGLLYLYRKVIFRIHYYYEDILSGKHQNIGAWRYDELLISHFKLVFDENNLLKMQKEKWSVSLCLTFIEKHLISELRNAVTGEFNSKIILEQAMKNIELVSKVTMQENQRGQ
ncbi:hypothetical protein [Pseudocolwellia agarivorans]|uniref:hypothetical protein n=1 Tax=Pseudocolwellia agarivorans TaxID=1911682 RepID=UPI000984327D|nr:hypothetical protein [Pseudocolwellia agarivorans]